MNRPLRRLILHPGANRLFTIRSKHVLGALATVVLARGADSGDSKKPDTPASDSSTTIEGAHERAERELKEQQRQRILGVIPNFNTSNVSDAAPLSGGQKFRLALRSTIDPFTFVTAGIDAGLSQRENAFAGYGQGGQGYAKRYAASFTDSFSGTMFSGALFPVLLHADPRYFRKGTGSFLSRVGYSLSTTVKAKDDRGRWVPNYSNIFGNLAAGGLANAYYPASDRGAALTFERAASVIAWGAIGSTFIEFWPDISSKVFHKH
jgi:hypothetical protein